MTDTSHMIVANAFTTPALSLDLYGMHLIEASAGTGKTWALSALIVRLLVERKLQTRQIVATTFTRAAAAELQDRIRLRIHEVWALLNESLSHPERAIARAEQNKDVLGLYLLHKLSVPERQAASNQLRLSLDTFDELFINTLDSFCQKILREFAFDVGQGEPREISEQDQQLIQQLIHDALREWRSQQDPRLIEMLVLSGAITDVADHERVVQTVMNFLSAQIAPVTDFEFDYPALSQFQATLAAEDWGSWLETWARAQPYFYGNRILANFHDAFPALIEWMSHASLEDILTMADNRPEMKLLSLFEEQKFSTNFNKAGFALPWIQDHLNSAQSERINDFVRLRSRLLGSLKHAKAHLHHHIVLHVREQFPQLLAEHRETTFAEQMHMLAQALEGESGLLLAQQIRHRYPVALVDEFQDTNSDQDRVVERVYRQFIQSEIQQQRFKKDDPDAPCLILVGDPKQAIYGFRGGDIHTYLSAKKQVMDSGQVHALDQNQRSVAPLVDAVNAFLSHNDTLGDGVDYPEVTAAPRDHAPLIDHGVENPTPLRLIQLNEDSDELSQTAWRIMQLLRASADGQLQIKGKPVLPQDIAVLASSHRDLNTVEQYLQAANIPVWRQSKTSVFLSPLTYDLAAIMQLMLSPYREDYFRRALSGVMIGKTLAELDTLEEQAMDFAEQQAAFAIDAQVWAKSGFLAAWQRIAGRYQIWQRLARDHGTAAGVSGERHLVNLRHLIELLHRQSERRVGSHHLLAWLLRQVAKPSERGDEVERALPSQSGVQMMTIHGSKGLEFPIVFAVGIKDKLLATRTKQPEVVFYLEDEQRTLGFDSQVEEIMDQHAEREVGEERRLLYVALTRAKYRQYLFLKAQKTNAKGQTSLPSFSHWFPLGVNDFVGQHPALVQIEDPLNEVSDFRYQPPKIERGTLATRHIAHRHFKAWGMTSFSALVRDVEPVKLEVLLANDLVRPEYADDEPQDEYFVDSAIMAMPPVKPTAKQLKQAQAEQALALKMKQGELLLPTSDIGDDIAPDDVRFRFQRGANGGNCLHKILEYLDPRFDDDARSKWTDTFAKQMQSHAIPDVDPETMVAWFRDIVDAPLPDGAKLSNLKFNARVRELEFHLSLKDERIDGDALVKRLHDSGIQVPQIHKTQAIRYLKGFIDLVYEHQGQFYVADYKSNYLGDGLEHYSAQAMKDSMTHSGYWLQAALYLVALHRYLKVRLPNYEISKHLGGACYMYLRGMHAQSDQTGIVYWRPDPQLVLDLDVILGQAQIRSRV